MSLRLLSHFLNLVPVNLVFLEELCRVFSLLLFLAVALLVSDHTVKRLELGSHLVIVVEDFTHAVENTSKDKQEDEED
jgi:hypothetical protein